MLPVWGGAYIWRGLFSECYGISVQRGNDYSREVVNQGMAVIRGNSVGKKNKPLAHREGRNMDKIFDSTVT